MTVSDETPHFSEFLFIKDPINKADGRVQYLDGRDHGVSPIINN